MPHGTREKVRLCSVNTRHGVYVGDWDGSTEYTVHGGLQNSLDVEQVFDHVIMSPMIPGSMSISHRSGG